uniref:2-oxo acid dehydrogenase subunit E2 n=1 Tax=Polaribacter sp. TaxID=1920175 RepID=UPI0040480D81
MAIVVNMPRLSDTMEEGVVAKWLKNIGDTIQEGDILAEIETDKATMEFESFNEGTLLHIGVHEGESAPVDSLLAIIGDKGEDISSLLNGNTEEKPAPTKDAEPSKETQNTAASAASTVVPEGVKVITMPRLSDTMTDGTVASWLKTVGDSIEEGDILTEIETDKATMEFESFNEGTLLYIGVKEGESAPVDSLLAIIGKTGTDVSALVAAHKAGTLSEGSSTNETAIEKPKESAMPAESNTNESAPKSNNSTGRILASPLAKKIAKDKGIQIEAVTGSGENGRIIKKDVENYTPVAASAPAQQTAHAASNAVTSFVPAGEEHEELVKNSQMRKAIAKSLANSKFNAPHFYLTIEVDMENAMESRATINAIPDTKVSFNDMVVKACAMALKKHPQVNTSWTEEATIYKSQIHVGVAVAVDEGLVVPVLKFTDQMSLTQIGAAVRDLAGKARNKKIAPAEMQGSTFTISNLGMFGIQEFTSIINQPNSAILSVGAIVEKPVVKNGQIVIGNTMKVTLACDHRTVDGAVGAQFLQTLRTYLENPVTMLA